MIQTVRLWSNGTLSDVAAGDGLPSKDLGPNDLLWVDFCDPSQSDLKRISRHFGLTSLGIADVVEPHERTKVVRHVDHLSFVCYAAVGEDSAAMVRLSGFVFDRILVTVRADPSLSISRLLERWKDESELVAFGPAYLLYSMFDEIVDAYFDHIEAIEDQLEDIEDLLFEDSLSNEVQQRLYRIRRDLSRLRRAVSPMRELVIDFTRHFAKVPQLSGYFDDVYDHALRASEWIDSLRDTISFIVETNLSLQDTRMNEIMKKLASWAAIISVPTLVTGFFGQNIPFFGFNDPAGLWLSGGLLVTSVSALWLAFRKNGWL